MPNLYGSNIKKDIKDFKKLWSKDFCPDELKIYPTSIIKNTVLEKYFNEENNILHTHTMSFFLFLHQYFLLLQDIADYQELLEIYLQEK
jgi:hypothetical protein